MNTEIQCLRRYHERGDAFAFHELVQAHAAMVFATAQRVTRNSALAEDVAQETFLELARHSHGITESVGAWLHRVAWRRACNAARNEAARRRYEEAGAKELHAEREATWEEMEPLIDEALDVLPDKLRAPLVEHFLEGRGQQEIAVRLGVSQSTISRAIEAGIGELRARMKDKGLLCGAGLGLLLGVNAAQAAPASLCAALGKLAVSGIGTNVTAKAAGGASAWKACIAWLLHPAAVPVALAAGAFVWLNSRGKPVAPAPQAPSVATIALGAPSGLPALQQWDCQILCATCATAYPPSRFGIVIREENGQQAIYHLRGAVSRFHETYCPDGKPGAARVTGTPGNESGLPIFRLKQLQPRP